MKAGFVFAVLLVLAGCASAPPAIPDPSRQADAEALQVKADKEVFGLRVDVYRNERRGAGTMDLSGGASTSSVAVIDASDYALTGVDAGNGLFLDTNGNLAVDLVRLYQIKAPFHIEETVAGLVPYTVTYIYQGSKFERKGGGSDLPDQVVTFSRDAANVSTKNSQSSIYLDSDRLIFQPSGFHVTGKVTLRQVRPDRVELEGMLGNGSYITTGEDDAYLTSKFTLQFNAKVLSIILGGAMLGNGATCLYVRTPEGCWFSDPKGKSHEISLQDSTITVSKNGKVERTYNILPTN
jgi:hypothetical protein